MTRPGRRMVSAPGRARPRAYAARTVVYYPVNDFGPLMHGMVIGGLGIFHVFTAQFAIGGGMLLCYFQWLSQPGRTGRPRNPHARAFVDGYFRWLILVSFVLGAVTGVAMWFTTIQVSPRTIGMMVDEFHWVWATEWTFFCVEVVAGYAFYRYAPRLADRDRMTLLVLYSLAAWGSLFWINGILSWQLTPGTWPESRAVWVGFFNPSFWPSLLYRTAASMTIAALVACVVVNTMTGLDREGRRGLINRCAHFLASLAAMPLLGLWYLASIPEDSRSWVLGGSAAMTLFLGLAVATSTLIGGYAVVGLLAQRLYINGATATLLAALAVMASAGGEFVREGVRKPYTIRRVLYSNAIEPGLVARLREVGCVTHDPFPLRDAAAYPTEQLRLGARVFRVQCQVCHTISGVNGLVHLAGPWTTGQKRLNIAKLQHTKSYMPPFAGTPIELEALVQLVEWEHAGRPRTWPGTAEPDRVHAEIARFLQEAGTTRPADRGAVSEGR